MGLFLLISEHIFGGIVGCEIRYSDFVQLWAVLGMLLFISRHIYCGSWTVKSPLLFLFNSGQFWACFSWYLGIFLWNFGLWIEHLSGNDRMKWLSPLVDTIFNLFRCELNICGILGNEITTVCLLQSGQWKGFFFFWTIIFLREFWVVKSSLCVYWNLGSERACSSWNLGLFFEEYWVVKLPLVFVEFWAGKSLFLLKCCLIF